MIKVNIVAVGKVKEKYFSDGIEEYRKRLGKYCEFNIIELQEENYQKVDDALILQIKEKEGEKILSAVKGYVFAMAIEGKKFSSEKFAQKIKELTDSGKGVITFVIGGSYGLSDKVKAKADALISFSDMTFPHTLFRLMLTEQIYRAFSITGGSAYHK
jgi:23S rRNA (pseudouridine1915-N3)-methyltransferase